LPRDLQSPRVPEQTSREDEEAELSSKKPMHQKKRGELDKEIDMLGSRGPLACKTQTLLAVFPHAFPRRLEPALGCTRDPGNA
jgi:hypothetical protein